MIITRDVLTKFEACENGMNRFCELYPDGLDISGLWGSLEKRKETWERLLVNEFLRRQIGWAIEVGLIPVRIIGDFAGMDLTEANLRGANLGISNFRDVDLRGADLRGADLRWANLRKADLRHVNLRGADLYGVDLRAAIMSDEQRKYAREQGAIC